MRATILPLLLSAVLLNSCEAAEQIVVHQTVPSPTGEYRAVLLARSGGGAAGWCYQGIYITEQTAKAEHDRDEEVFHVSCSSNVSLEWKEARHLEVSFTIDRAGVQTLQRVVSLKYPVRVSYAVIDREAADPNSAVPADAARRPRG